MKRDCLGHLIKCRFLSPSPDLPNWTLWWSNGVCPRFENHCPKFISFTEGQGLCPSCVPATRLGTAHAESLLILMVMGVFDSHFTDRETETQKGERDWIKVTHWGTPCPGNPFPGGYPHIPPLAYRPFLWLWCLLTSTFHPGRVPVAPSCAHTGLPGEFGAVKALMAGTCIVQVRG